MNVTSGIVKNRSKQGRGYESPTIRAACSIGSPTCAWCFSKACRLMPWLMKMLDHHTLGESPGTTSVNDFSQARPAQKGAERVLRSNLWRPLPSNDFALTIRRPFGSSPSGACYPWSPTRSHHTNYYKEESCIGD